MEYISAMRPEDMKTHELQTVLKTLLRFSELLPEGHGAQMAALIGKLPTHLVADDSSWYWLTEDMQDVRKMMSTSDRHYRNLLVEVMSIWKAERREHRRVLEEKDRKINGTWVLPRPSLED